MWEGFQSHLDLKSNHLRSVEFEKVGQSQLVKK